MSALLQNISKLLLQCRVLFLLMSVIIGNGCVGSTSACSDEQSEMVV